MSVKAYRTGSAGRHLLLARGSQETTRDDEFVGQVRVSLVSTISDHHGRPVIHLLGQVRRLQVGDETVEIVDDDGLPMAWEYQFTRAQLVELTRRGLLENGLGPRPFVGLAGQELSLPVPVRLSMLSQDDRDYLFVTRQPQRAECPLLTVGNCGYDFVEFFEQSDEVDPLVARQQRLAERELGFEALFAAEQPPIETEVVREPGDREDFLSAAQRLARSDEGPTSDTEPGQVATAQPGTPTGPETGQLDEWFVPEPGMGAVLDGVDREHAESEQDELQEQERDHEEVEAAVRQEGDFMSTQVSRLAQRLGTIPSAYRPDPDLPEGGAAAAAEFDPLEF